MAIKKPNTPLTVFTLQVVVSEGYSGVPCSQNSGERGKVSLEEVIEMGPPDLSAEAAVAEEVEVKSNRTSTTDLQV